MSENTKMEVVETTEVVETEKVGVLTKVKDFAKKHKKGLIVGTAAAGLAIVGLVKLIKKGNNDEYDYDSDDYIDVDAEEVCDDDETIE